jgi:hypothetical protein
MFFDVYYCKEENLIDIKKFPKLRFFKKETNTTFIFNFEDLFIKVVQNIIL